MRDLMTKHSVFYLRKESYADLDDYREDFKKVILQREYHRFPFAHQSPQLAYRKQLVNYIKNVCIDGALSQSCLHLTIYIMDIFMDNHNIIPEQILLVASVCLLLAAKFEETTVCVPKISELMALTDGRYLVHDYKRMEITILRYFDFYIMFPTAAHYTFYYMQEAICHEDLGNGDRSFRTIFYDLHHVITIYLDKIIDDIHFMQCYLPSKLAAAIIAAGRHKIGLTAWPTPLREITEYELEDLLDIATALLTTPAKHCPICQISESLIIANN